ncbi:cytochrome P450 [Glaciihabitans arcticus]|uniref:Cytochrome P450 n=2 Tax=Glaciihabitans arcticus TaxID=2668039 RepID=A0A4V2JF88_9MICO|nr:cytochrome P450 [Glaciihabitans arcticus]
MLWEERVMRAAHPVAYRALKAAKKPVLRVPGLGVLVTNATLLRGVLMDTEHFSKKGPGASSELWTPILGPSLLLNMDGADHMTLRRKLGPLFSPSYVDALAAASLTDAVASLGERLRAGEAVDVVAEVRRCASLMIGQLVGVPVEMLDDDLFARVSAITGFVKLSKPRFTPAQVEIARAVLGELTAHSVVAYREGGTDTVPGRMRELGLTEDEAMGAVGAFVMVGTETLVSYIPRLVAVLVDSGWFPQLAADPSLVEPAIAEGLRVTTPSPVMLRSVVGAAAIGPVAVRTGERVILATFAANRALGPFDPSTNVASTMRQLWFGAGTHFCLGAPLAMAQIRLVTDALLSAGDVRIVSRTASRGVMIPSYSTLVVQKK